MRLKVFIALVAILFLSGCQPKLLEDGNTRAVDVSEQSSTISRIQYYYVEGGLALQGASNDKAFEIDLVGHSQSQLHGLNVSDPHCFSVGQITEQQKTTILAQIDALETVSSADIEAVPADISTEYIDITYLDQHTSRIYLSAYNFSAQYLVAINGSALSQSLKDLANQLAVACQ